MTITKTWAGFGAGVSLGAGEVVRVSVCRVGGDGEVPVVLVAGDAHETARETMSASKATARILNMVASALAPRIAFAQHERKRVHAHGVRDHVAPVSARTPSKPPGP